MKKIATILVIGMFLVTSTLVTSAGQIKQENVASVNASVAEDESISIPAQQPVWAGNWYKKPLSYGQLVNWYLSLEEKYPNYLEVFKANEMYDTGKVYGGYDLYYVRITNEALGLHKPEVLFLGSPHGDETVGTICNYWFTDWLMRMAFTDESCPDYSKDWLRWLIDNREIYIEVSHNPWGFNWKIRFDRHLWDLNREADYNGPGWPNGGIWGSVPGKTLRRFVDNHIIRVGADHHGGARMLLYPWASTHPNVNGTSPLSGYKYHNAPPDFYYYDASCLRLGDYIGNYKDGYFEPSNTGPIGKIWGFELAGLIASWAYGADVEKNPVEDPYVKDEIFGNYPGSGILWVSPEWSYQKNPPKSDFGNDITMGYGIEVRRFLLHQTDLAQPYIRWQQGTTGEFSCICSPITLKWQVNGSLVVDHTYVQWGTDPDPINNPQYTTPDYDEHAADYLGGTGWDDAEDGKTAGVTYIEDVLIDMPGDYYFVAKAQVDQIYGDVLHPEVYGNNPYLRLIKERTNDNYYEMLEGTDGTEEIFGQTWWYSPIIHIKVVEPSNPPEIPTIDGPLNGDAGVEYEYTFLSVDPENEDIKFYINWSDGNSEWTNYYSSGEIVTISHTWDEEGTFTISAIAMDICGAVSDWGYLEVEMPYNNQGSQSSSSSSSSQTQSQGSPSGTEGSSPTSS